MNVKILCTCRSPELLDYSLLVFKSLRVGFPTADILVVGNALPDFAFESVRLAAKANDCAFGNGPETIHHKWIERLLETETELFILCDCDMHFFESVEDWAFQTALAGFRVPEFYDEFSGAITRARLHTSLLFIDPVKVREAVKAYESKIADTPFTPKVNLIFPLVLPLKDRSYFHDTCSLLFQAIGGTSFTDAQLDAFTHLNFGSCSDIVLPRLSNGDKMKQWREAVLNNPELGRGAWRMQEEFYRNRQPVYDGRNVIAPGTLEESDEATKWRNEICLGDPDAVVFCNLAFIFFHGVDDLMDSYQDGRPMMAKDILLGLFVHAAAFYNCRFYRAHQELLFPMLLDITTTYSDSVAFERSPKPWLRTIADVERMAGNRLYAMVALICGGQSHRDRIARQIKEVDWLKQHSADGRPI